jgi:hypothetical protein
MKTNHLATQDIPGPNPTTFEFTATTPARVGDVYKAEKYF